MGEVNVFMFSDAGSIPATSIICILEDNFQDYDIKYIVTETASLRKMTIGLMFSAKESLY